ncbi:MAG: nucleotidyltransferase family protein [Candidatus Omnitrophota bacterium]
MISAILLTAGLSSRFLSPKALAGINGSTVIRYLQNKLLESEVAEIIIVLGAHAPEIKPYILKHKKVKVVYNKDYILGQTSSFKVGWSVVASPIQGVLLMPVDYPAVTVETINLICRSFALSSPLLLIPTFEGKKGHPPVFHVALREEIMRLDNSAGLNQIARQHVRETVYLPVQDPGVRATFNTPEELGKLKKNLRFI